MNNPILNQNTGWLLIAIFSVTWITLGYLWGKKAKTLDGYMVAGRNVGLALGSATAVATWITSNTTMLAPQFALQLGIWGMLAYCTASLGLFLFAPISARIKKLMPVGYTSVEFMRLRYGKGVYIAFLIISIFYSLTWMVSMSMAGGLLLETLAGVPYKSGMSIILFVCVAYTILGGLYAVIGTDFIQSLIILIGIFVVAITVISETSLTQIYDQVKIERPALLDVMYPAAIMSVFNNLLFGLGEIFHSNVWWSRAFAMRDGVGLKAYFIAGLLWLPVPVVAGFLGLSADALGISIARPDIVGPLIAAELLGSVGAVLVFIIVFCSLASSIDSLLAATSDLIINDIIKPAFKLKNETKLRKASMYVILFIGFITWLISLPKIGSLATVLFFAGPMVGSLIWPILLGLYSQKANPHGVLSSIILGSASGLWAYFNLGWYTATLIATFVSFIIVSTSTLIRPHQFNWSDLNPQKIEEGRS